jgi:hypothetical protein
MSRDSQNEDYEGQLPNNHGGLQQRSYLLRLWRSGVDGEWRASLQSVQSGERHVFVDLEALLTFLVEEVNPPAKWDGPISPIENG